MLNREGEVNHNNPIYSAGFMEGRKFERELLKEQQEKKALRVNVTAMDLDIVKELIVLTKDMADYVAFQNDQHPTPRGLALIKGLDNLLTKYEQKTIENEKKMESEGVTVIRQ